MRSYIDILKDTSSRSDAFWYGIVYVLGRMQERIIRRCIKDPVWRTADGRFCSPRTMTDVHLKNTIRMLERTGETTDIYPALCAERARRMDEEYFEGRRRRFDNV